MNTYVGILNATAGVLVEHNRIEQPAQGPAILVGPDGPTDVLLRGNVVV